MNWVHVVPTSVAGKMDAYITRSLAQTGLCALSFPFLSFSSFVSHTIMQPQCVDIYLLTTWYGWLVHRSLAFPFTGLVFFLLSSFFRHQICRQRLCQQKMPPISTICCEDPLSEMAKLGIYLNSFRHCLGPALGPALDS